MTQDLPLEPAREIRHLGTVRPLAGDALKLSALGFGAAAVGNLYSVVTDEEAETAIVEALRQGIRHFDTTPFYGYGLSERRLISPSLAVGLETAIMARSSPRLIVDSCPPSSSG